MAKSSAYWKRRSELNYQKAERAGFIFSDEASKATKVAEKNITIMLESFYGKYADNNEITYTEAKKLLTSREIKEYKGDVDKYIEQAKKYGNDPEWKQELRNQSIKYRVSRLEGLMTGVKAQVENLYGQTEKASKDLLSGLYMETFNENTFDIQKATGVGVKFNTPNVPAARKAVETNWSGKSFSDLWGDNKKRLERQLATLIPQAFTTGRTLQDLSTELSEKMGVASSAAGRLVSTEVSRIANQASVDSMKESGLEGYTILITLDNKTSPICQAVDESQVHKLEDAEPGLNLPPLHPWCRSTIIPSFEDMKGVGSRLIKDESGTNFKVPRDMTYNQWKETIEKKMDFPKPPKMKPIELPAPWTPTPPVVELSPPVPETPPPKETTVQDYSEDRQEEALDFDNKEDADEVLRPWTAEWWKNTPDKIKQSIYKYTVSPYGINDYLRGLSPGNKKQIKDIENMIKLLDEQKLPQDMILHRGVDTGFFLSNPDMFGLKLGQGVETIYKNKEKYIGKSFTDKGFTSTSTSREENTFSGPDNIKMEIYTPKGSKAAYLEPFSNFGGDPTNGGLKWDGNTDKDKVGDEAEVLLQANTDFVIQDVVEDPTSNHGFKLILSAQTPK